MIPSRLSAAGAALAVAPLLLAAATPTTATAATTTPTTATAAATTPTTATAASTVSASVTVPPGLIRALQRDLRLTRAQALARLDREERARRLLPGLRAALGPRYAGAWVDRDGRLVVATTDDAAGTAVAAAGARLTVVDRSLAKLTSIKNALDAAARRVPATAAAVWFVDERTNAVVVQALDAVDGEAFVRASGVDRAAVRVQIVAERPVPLYGLRGGDAYHINSGARCSVGFAVNQGSTHGFVTAGHCGGPGASTTGYNGVAQGTFQGSSFPGDDYAWVAANASWAARPAVNGYGAGQIPVFGSAEAPVGSAVCRSGSTTQWRCGVIEQRDTSVTYSQGTVFQVVRTSACAEPGDSGGSYLAGNQAQGVLSGGSGNCASGGTTFFQPVNEILGAYGLTLTTMSTHCVGYPNTYFTDMTSRQGSFGLEVPNPGLHPEAGFTSAGAGTHTACLGGPGSARMRLSLERYTCCGPFGLPSWTQVATAAPGPTPKTVTSSQGPGTYRWVVSVDEGLVGPSTPIGEYYLLGTASPA